MGEPTLLVVPQADSDQRATILNRVNTALAVFACFGVLLAIGMGALFLTVDRVGGQVESLQSSVEALAASSAATSQTYELNRDRGEKIAANTCVMIIALGQQPTPDCQSPEVLEHYDPDAVRPLANPSHEQFNSEMLCRIAGRLGIDAPACGHTGT